MSTPTRIPLAALLVAGIVAALLLSWSWATDRPVCHDSSVLLGCLGSAVAVAVVGLPAGALLGSLALRVGGARFPGRGALALTGLLLVAPSALPFAGSLPTTAWPVLAAVLAAAYLVLEGRTQRS